MNEVVGKNNVVALEWNYRLEPLPEEDGTYRNCFLRAFYDALQHRGNQSRGAGDRYGYAKATEAGIAAMVQAILGCGPDTPPCKVHTDNITKSADISFTLQNGVQLIFEVKHTLEFNSLAAAATEAKLFKKRRGNGSSIFFVLFSFGGKSYNTDKATKVLDEIFEDCPIDKVFVLSEAAGATPYEGREEHLRNQLLSSLREFSEFLSKLASPIKGDGKSA